MRLHTMHVVISAVSTLLLFGICGITAAGPCDEAALEEAKELLRSSNPEKALEILDRCLQAQPENYTALFWTGYTQYTSGNYREAADDFDLLTKFHPNDIRAKIFLGNARMHLNHLGDAKIAFTAALELDPENVSAMIGLGWTEYLDGKTFQAVSLLKKALALQPSNRSLKQTIGQLETFNEQVLADEAEERKRRIVSLVGEAMVEAAAAGSKAESGDRGKKKPGVAKGVPPMGDLIPPGASPRASQSLGASRRGRFENR